MALPLRKPRSISDNKSFIFAFDDFVTTVMEGIKVGDIVEKINDYDELRLFMKSNSIENSSRIYIVYQNRENLVSNTKKINKILKDFKINEISDSTLSNPEGSIPSVSIKYLEKDHTKSIQELLVMHLHCEKIKKCYDIFYNELKEINKKPDGGQEISYYRVLPALYDDKSSMAQFINIAMSKYKDIITF